MKKFTRSIELFVPALMTTFLTYLMSEYLNEFNTSIYTKIVLCSTIVLFGLKFIHFVWGETKPVIHRQRKEYNCNEYKIDNNLCAAVRTYNKQYELGLISKSKRNERRKFYTSQLNLIRYV